MAHIFEKELLSNGGESTSKILLINKEFGLKPGDYVEISHVDAILIKKINEKRISTKVKKVKKIREMVGEMGSVILPKKFGFNDSKVSVGEIGNGVLVVIKKE